MNIRYSFIIPHHNIPSLLRRCLASIPRRDDVEIFVVDDCSDKAYEEDLKDVRLCNPDVKFIALERCMGGGAARNAGLQQATGQYVVFADADDFFNECLNDVLDNYRDTDYDLVFFKGNSVDSVTHEPADRADHLNRYVDDYLTGKDPDAIRLRYLFGEPWARLVKLSVIRSNKIKFDELFIHNDTAFAYLVGYYSKNIHVDGRALYCVTVRSGSVSGALGLDKTLTRMQVFGRATLFLRDHHIAVRPIRHYEHLWVLLVNRRFSHFIQSVKLLYGLGLSRWEIFSGMMITLVNILNNKRKKKRL